MQHKNYYTNRMQKKHESHAENFSRKMSRAKCAKSLLEGKKENKYMLKIRGRSKENVDTQTF